MSTEAQGTMLNAGTVSLLVLSSSDLEFVFFVFTSSYQICVRKNRTQERNEERLNEMTENRESENL